MCDFSTLMARYENLRNSGFINADLSILTQSFKMIWIFPFKSNWDYGITRLWFGLLCQIYNSTIFEYFDLQWKTNFCLQSIPHYSMRRGSRWIPFHLKIGRRSGQLIIKIGRWNSSVLLSLEDSSIKNTPIH